MAKVAAPLVIGTVELADGSRVKGFLCEGHAVASAVDITGFGGWRNYLRRDGRKLTVIPRVCRALASATLW